MEAEHQEHLLESNLRLLTDQKAAVDEKVHSLLAQNANASSSQRILRDKIETIIQQFGIKFVKDGDFLNQIGGSRAELGVEEIVTKL
jgi:hypothetical protein